MDFVEELVLSKVKKWTFPRLLTRNAQLVFSESRRINHASKGKTVTKTYGVTAKNHHVPVINIQQIINHSADHHLLMTFLSGQTQMRSLSLFLCKSTFLQNHLRHCDGQHLQNDLLVVGIPSTVKALSNLWSRGGGAFGWFSQQRLGMCCYFPHIAGSKLFFPQTPFISFTFSATFWFCFLSFPAFINSATIYQAPTLAKHSIVLSLCNTLIPIFLPKQSPPLEFGVHREEVSKWPCNISDLQQI